MVEALRRGGERPLTVFQPGETSGPRWRSARSYQFATVRLDQVAIHLARPLTFMNRSGTAARELLEAAGIQPAELLVVADDVSLPMGRLRFRTGGSSGGHRGLESLVTELGTSDFPRLRVGVGGPPVGQDLAEYVLEPLSGASLAALEDLAATAAEAAVFACLEGVSQAMNRYNGRSASSAPEQAEETGGAALANPPLSCENAGQDSDPMGEPF